MENKKDFWEDNWKVIFDLATKSKEIENLLVNYNPKNKELIEKLKQEKDK